MKSTRIPFLFFSKRSFTIRGNLTNPLNHEVPLPIWWDSPELHPIIEGAECVTSISLSLHNDNNINNFKPLNANIWKEKDLSEFGTSQWIWRSKEAQYKYLMIVYQSTSYPLIEIIQLQVHLVSDDREIYLHKEISWPMDTDMKKFQTQWQHNYHCYCWYSGLNARASRYISSFICSSDRACCSKSKLKGVMHTGSSLMSCRDVR